MGFVAVGTLSGFILSGLGAYIVIISPIVRINSPVHTCKGDAVYCPAAVFRIGKGRISGICSSEMSPEKGNSKK